MENIKRKLSYYSFAQQAEETLKGTLLCLRDVKRRYALCSAECFEGAPVSLETWKLQRSKCLEPCKAMHDSFFSVFNTQYKAYSDQAKRCVFNCGTEYPVSKFGEEDLMICEEQCYENLTYGILQLNSELSKIYQESFLERFEGMEEA